MTTTELHPSELAYGFSYAGAKDIIGWGMAPFLPGPEDGDPARWPGQGEARMVAAGRLTGPAGAQLNFSDEMAAAILALVDPGLVLLAQRRAEDGVQTMTVHARRADLFGLTRHPDGMFAVTRLADLTAAAGACAAFAGASIAPPAKAARIETDHDTLSGLRRLAQAGRTDEAAATLTECGLPAAQARSAALALGAPSAAGVVSVLTCRDNAVTDAETFSLMTDAQDHTWAVFPPASLDGPMILERSSVGALGARIAVDVAARQAAAAAR